MKKVRDEILKLVLSEIEPKGKSPVALSPHFAEIVARMLSGFSWKEIAAWLKDTYQEEMKWEDIRLYYDRFLRDDYRDLRNNERDIVLDTLQEMTNRYHEIRALNKKCASDLVKAEISWSKELQEGMKLEMTYLKQIRDIQKEMGMLKQPEVEAPTPEQALGFPVTDDVLNKMEKVLMDAIKAEMESGPIEEV